MLLAGAALLFAATDLHPLGSDHAICRPDEPGPALEVSVIGLKDRKGVLRVELYPADDADFLADDDALLAAGKVFRRVDTPTPADGSVVLCIRAPEAGPYAVVVMHDRNGDGKFKPFGGDGAALATNPKLGFFKPKASQATTQIGPGLTQIAIVMNYWNGLLFRPLSHR